MKAAATAIRTGKASFFIIDSISLIENADPPRPGELGNVMLKGIFTYHQALGAD
jgi:hypothetical protein